MPPLKDHGVWSELAKGLERPAPRDRVHGVEDEIGRGADAFFRGVSLFGSREEDAGVLSGHPDEPNLMTIALEGLEESCVVVGNTPSQRIAWANQSKLQSVLRPALPLPIGGNSVDDV